MLFPTARHCFGESSCFMFRATCASLEIEQALYTLFLANRVILTIQGTIVNGTIASVSPVMNVALRAVKYTPRSRDTVALDTMTVRGSTVRYVILPDALPLDTLLIDDAPKPKNKARKEQDRGTGGRGAGGRGGPRGRGGRGGGRGRGRGRGF